MAFTSLEDAIVVAFFEYYQTWAGFVGLCGKY